MVVDSILCSGRNYFYSL